MPVSVCLGLGTNQSAHVGDSELSRYVDYINEDSQVSVSVAAGNEGAAQHHYTAELDYVKNQDTVELRIADKEEGFSMEFWGDPPDDYGISLQSPAGEKLYVSSSLGAGTQELSFIFVETKVLVNYVKMERMTGKQLIYFRFFHPAAGIWKVNVSKKGISGSRFHMWLPVQGLISPDTYFLESTPYITVTAPGDSTRGITATAYQYLDNSLYFQAGRGFTPNNQVTPDLAAPGVDLLIPLPGGAFGKASGSSLSSAVVAGAAALVQEWAIVRGNIPYASGNTVKFYLQKGAVREEQMEYPNPGWGYGRLDLYRTLYSFRPKIIRLSNCFFGRKMLQSYKRNWEAIMKRGSIFETDGIPRMSEALPLAMQHVVAMIVGCVTPAIIVSGAVPGGLSREDQVILIQSALVIAALSTLLQLFPIGGKAKFAIGSGLPIIMGVSFAYVPSMQAIAESYGIAAIMGAEIVGGIVAVVMGLLVKKIRVFFPPLITGTVVFTIGLSLYPTAINYMAGGTSSPNYGSWQNWAIAFFTLIVVTALNHFGKGIWKLASILIGIIVGYLVSIPFGMVDFSSIGEAGVCQLPSLMHFGVQFEPSSCVALGILFAINSIQAIGDYSATTIGAMDRTPKDDELQRGIVGYGLSNVVGALLGGLPTATYSQNVGIVTTTKVINRWVLGLAAAILGIAGLVPKFSAILTTIPQCVLGGATVSVFASIAMTGMKLVASAEMDYRNSSIVGLAAALGMGVSQATAALASFPTWVTTIFGKSPVVLATIIAVMLNVILPKTRDEQKEEAKKKIKIEQKLEEDHREFGE